MTDQNLRKLIIEFIKKENPRDSYPLGLALTNLRREKSGQLTLPWEWTALEFMTDEELLDEIQGIIQYYKDEVQEMSEWDS